LQESAQEPNISGAKAKQMMLESGLPMETLGKIWDLSDVDKDGALDKVEFITALHLVYSCRQQPSLVLPPVLPNELIGCIRRGVGATPSMEPAIIAPPVLQSSPLRTSSRSSSVSSGIGLTSSPLPTLPVSAILPPHPQVQTTLVNSTPLSSSASPDGWVVSIDDREKYGRLFLQTDKDADGFVSGMEIKGEFNSIIQSLCKIKKNCTFLVRRYIYSHSRVLFLNEQTCFCKVVYHNQF